MLFCAIFFCETKNVQLEVGTAGAWSFKYFPMSQQTRVCCTTVQCSQWIGQMTKEGKIYQKKPLSFLRCSSFALCVESLKVLADIYISIFSNIFIAFTDTLVITCKLYTFSLLLAASQLLMLSSLLPVASKSSSRTNLS